MAKRKIHNHVIEQVPVDYYQKGVEKNIFQRIWHTNKLRVLLQFVLSVNRENIFKRILDVGCASGWMISNIADAYPGAKCYGVDVYEKGIWYAKKLYPHISFLVEDAHGMHFATNTFDLVTCTEVLEHVDNPKEVLLEIKRVLKRDGVAFIELDSGSPLFSLSWFLWKKSTGRVWNDAHLHSFNVKKLERMIVSCGFKIVLKKKFNLGMAMAFLIRNPKNE